MSRLSEYIKMVSNGLENPSGVIEGNINRLKDLFGALDEKTKAEANRRYEICVECPFNSLNASKTGFYSTVRVDEHCSLCLCPVKSKVMDMNSQCGIDRLAEVYNENNVKISGLDGYKILWGKYDING